MIDLNFDEIKRFLVKETGVKESKVTSMATLEGDLGITGDDAIELIIAFSHKFGVDVSKFKIEQYFAPEGDSILPSIIRGLIGKKPKKQKDLIVADLVTAIELGKLE